MCHAAQRRKTAATVDEIRAAGGVAHGFGSDARKEDQVVELVEHIEREIGAIEVFVFNIGANVPLQHPRGNPTQVTSRSGRWPASAAS